MLYEVKPLQGFRTTVNVPGSKSITNRALIIGALAEGRTFLKNVLFSDDTIYMMNALKALGVDLKMDEQAESIEINGQQKELRKASCFVGNAGTVMRFLPSFVAVKGGEAEITCTERMKSRPVSELVNILRQIGAEISYVENEGFPPINIKASGLNGGKVKVNANVSSQFLSSILLSAPYSHGDIYIEIEEELISKPFVDITMGIMQDFGVVVENENYKSFYVKAGQRYKAQSYTIESDCTGASYFFAAAAIANGDITVENINPYSLQGDIRFVDVLERMGAKVERGENYVRVVGNKLKGISIDMNDIPDVAQTLAVVALFAQGATEIKNVGNLRIKETDRIRALNNELTRLGARVEEKEDGLIIYPSESYQAADIETYDDHRMAMSFALTGLRISGVRIKDYECVAKTFPKFFEQFEKIYE
jgi:3-phosphoshikimate 1-carboxyvinyltransferase